MLIMLKINMSFKQRKNLENGYWQWFKSFQLKKFIGHLDKYPSFQEVIFKSSNDYLDWKNNVLNNRSISSLKDSELTCFKEYIICPPEDLFNLHSVSLTHVNSIKNTDLDAFLIDTYGNLRRSSVIRQLYQSEFDMRSCPYCNRNFMTSVIKRNNELYLTFELDHFHSKSENPFLAIVLYNLIPCCHTCNHVKRDSVANLIYPYLESYENRGKFEYSDKKALDLLLECTKNKKEPLVQLITSEDRISDSINQFYLRELYESHENEAEELLYKKCIFSNSLVKELIDDYFKKLGFDQEKINSIMYSSYLSEENHHNKLLSKYLCDLYKDLELKGI